MIASWGTQKVLKQLIRKNKKMDKATFELELKKIRKSLPCSGNVSINNEDCNFADNIFDSKNSYYVFESASMNECFYCEDGFKEINDIDCRFGLTGNNCCECLDFVDSTNCYYSQSFARCYDIWYCWYSVDCHDCFGCANLKNKSYCIFNIQYTEEEYKKKLSTLKQMSKEDVLKKRLAVIKQLPQLHSEHLDNTNSDYCDYAYFMKNCYYCFDCAHSQDCGYLTASYESVDSWDCDHVVRGEHIVECTYSGDIYNCYKVTDSARCYDSFFLEDCTDCRDCFGCNKLSHKQYCILNIQYTETEYKEMVSKLRDELGLHFTK